MVRYLHDVKSQPEEFAALDKALRHNVRNIFNYSTEDKRKNIVLVGGRSPDDFKFAEACKYPSELFQGPFPKEIDISKIDLVSAPITTKSLDGLLDRICGSDLWGKWAEETRGRHRRRRTGPEHEDSWYLRRAEDVLQMYDDAMEQQQAQWFRRTGPLAIDFDEGTFFHRRKKLAQLKSLVMNERVSILEGDAATGKTVLALHLAYELCGALKTQVYYFDCDKERDFDKSRLISDIRSVKDVIIIENIHLAPDKIQQVYSAFKYDKKRYFLFTSRSSLQLHLNSKSEDLTKVSPLHLEPFEDADGLIDEFLHSHSESPLSPELRQQIKDVSSDSLWLLAYALIGYVKTNGRGEPKSWILDSVTKDLQDLENISVDYPEALVAIAALYRDDLLMAEKYLVNNLGFSTAILNDLARQGELVRQETSTGRILYGLPHTALAKAYWECGSKYKIRRNIPEYEAFIYEYVSSGTPNGISVLVKTEEEICERVMARLESEGKLASVISNEQSTGAIGSWLNLAHNSTIAKDEILTILTHKIEEHDYAVYISELFKKLYWSGKEIWKSFCAQVDCERLVARMANTGGLVWVGITIYEMIRYDKPMMQKLYACIKLKNLIQEVNQTEELWNRGRCISAIYRVDDKAHRKLSKILNWENLADSLLAANLWSSSQCLQDILYANRNAARKLCDLMPLDKLVKYLDYSQEILENKGRLISTICKANPKKGKQLWQVYKEVLAKDIHQMKDPDKAASSLSEIKYVSPKMALELLSLLDMSKMPKVLSRTKDLTARVRFAVSLICLDKTKGQTFWQNYKNILAKTLSDRRAIRSVAPCIREVFFEDKQKELCDLLNIEKIAKNLNKSIYFWSVVDDIISAVLYAHKEKGQELWTNILFEEAPELGGRLFFDIWAGLSHIQDIIDIDSDIAEQLCGQLDIDELADRLSRSGWGFAKETGEWISTVHKLVPARRNQFWQRLNKKKIAESLSIAKDLEAVTSCIEQVDSISANWAKELCKQLDPTPLTFTLKQEEDSEIRERFLATIAKTCPSLCKQLQNLINQ